MRRLVNKFKKQQNKAYKEAEQNAPEGMLDSTEYKTLMLLNLIMNLYDDMIKVGHNPLNGNELYLNARFSAHAFMEDTVNTLKINYFPDEKTTEGVESEEKKD